MAAGDSYVPEECFGQDENQVVLFAPPIVEADLSDSDLLQDRVLLTTCRVEGTVVDWTGGFGWVAPAEPIEHRFFARQGGKLFLAAEDLQHELAVGSRVKVSFFVYADVDVVGAMEVQRLENSNSPAQIPFTSDKPIGFSGDLLRLKRMSGRGKGGKPRHRHGRRSQSQRVDVVAKATHVLYSHIWEDAEQIMHLEDEWSHLELSKRVSKYFCKATQMPGLLKMPWDEVVKHVLRNSMPRYAAGCSEKLWFFEFDIAPALCSGMCELVSAMEVGHRGFYQAVKRLTISEYERIMDELLLDKAIWEATVNIIDENWVGNKVFKVLQQARASALSKSANAGNSCVSDGRSTDSLVSEALSQVECFLESWVTETVYKLGSLIDDPVAELSQSCFLRLFQYLIAPFGKDHPFSCVPAEFTASIGRPPHDWDVLQDIVESCFEDRERTARRRYWQPMKRRRSEDWSWTDGKSSSTWWSRGGEATTKAKRTSWDSAWNSYGENNSQDEKWSRQAWHEADTADAESDSVQG
eukprot:TRINITY_DN21312_c2_g1_i1.p1 TRINITY_DN21312_c2_g1~~TRINITY_DN21312_c2_g1_i1.p1  ORF type:complete len:532 (+),score=91.77 TRINITY_DN21312_c2_g1_i1:25-1596(+)